jgi:hypothetical protein
MGRTVDVNELVGKVVKGTSEVMNHISGEQPNFSRRSLDVEYAINVIPSLRVVLTFDSIGVAIDETIPRDFQITEVLFGPFNFYAD